MKKKLLTAIMAMTMATACAVGFTACGDNNGNNSSNEWGNSYTVEAAYALAQDLGYTGTLEQFIETISGKDGLSAFEIYKKYHPEYTGTEEEWIESLKGSTGVGVKTAYVNDDGDLIIEFIDGATVNCGNISSAFYRLQYKAVEKDAEIVGYSVCGIGTVIDMDVIIPSTYNGKPVISIDDNAFYGCSSFTSITIPDGVTSIGGGAFYHCYKLTSIVIPTSVTYFGATMFYGASISDIYFKGTQKQWDAIVKEDSWQIGAYGCSIHYEAMNN